MAKVSVIIPVYNVEKYLPKCLESVLGQTFGDIEVICVNDGSTDNSLQILTEYANNDERIKIITKPNGGLFSARHVGMVSAVGEYILFVDSDDWIETTLIEKTVDKIRETNVDVVIFGAYSVKEDKIIKGMYSVNKIPEKFKERVLELKDYENALFRFPPTAWCKLYRKKFIDDNNIKFQEIKDGEDQLFYLHTILCAKNLYILNENLYYYIKNRTGAITADSKKTSVSPILNFYASEELLSKLNIKDKYVNQVINKYFSKTLSWYGKCGNDFKPEYYNKLLELKTYIDKTYPDGWWRYFNLNSRDNYITMKVKSFIAKSTWKLKKGK